MLHRLLTRAAAGREGAAGRTRIATTAAVVMAVLALAAGHALTGASAGFPSVSRAPDVASTAPAAMSAPLSSGRDPLPACPANSSDASGDCTVAVLEVPGTVAPSITVTPRIAPAWHLCVLHASGPPPPPAAPPSPVLLSVFRI